MVRNSRPPSPFNLFVAEQFLNGLTMRQCIAAWKLHKEEAEREVEREVIRVAMAATRREKQLEFEKNTKARIIQKQWREAISNPTFKLCKDRLMNEFNSMV